MTATTLYLTEQGGKIGINAQRLYLRKDEEKLMEIPLGHVERVFIFGRVQMTTQAMTTLMDRQTPVAFLTFNGRFRGHLTPVISNDARIRLAQWKLATDPVQALQFAKAFVTGKVRNTLWWAQEQTRRQPNDKLKQLISRLMRLLNQIQTATSVEEVMGYEGVSASNWFATYPQFFKADIRFGGLRNRRPPKDPVNSLLSLGYTLITSETRSLLEAFGCDPYVGFLHSIKAKRPSFACDVVEQFRTPITERWVAQICNLKQVNESDFEARNDGILLKTDSFKRVIGLWEQFMRSKPPTWCRPVDGATTMRKMMQLHIEAMANRFKWARLTPENAIGHAEIEAVPQPYRTVKPDNPF